MKLDHVLYPYQIHHSTTDRFPLYNTNTQWNTNICQYNILTIDPLHARSHGDCATITILVGERFLCKRCIA